MGVVDYSTPRYAPSHLSPRAAKRFCSGTLASGEDGSAPAIRTRGLAAHSYPTPPLSASSSASSGSTSSAASGSFPSFGSFAWKPDLAGPPMTLHDSPMGYATPMPDLDLDAAMLSHMHSAKHPLHDPPSQAPMSNTIPLHPLDGNRLTAQRAVDPSILPPKAPALEQQQLDVNPLLDGVKPWQQQEYVEGLIGVSMMAIASIWPNAAAQATDSPGSPGAEVLPLKYFIQETLRRSRSSAIVLQVALYYLHKGRNRIRERVRRAEEAKQRFSVLVREKDYHQASAARSNPYPTPPASPILDEFSTAAAEVLATSKDPVICGRRMFLAALITASKYLLDRTYSNRAWSRLSGLPVAEINANERAFLSLLEYKLYIGGDLMTNWQARLRKLQDQEGIVSPKARAGITRTHSDTLAHHQLPMSELRAGRADRVVPAVPSGLASSVTRSHSSAHLPTHFPEAMNAHPRAGDVHPKPSLQRTATFGLSRSSSVNTRMPLAHHGSDYASSPLRWSSPAMKHRSCSSASSLGSMAREQHAAQMQDAY